MAIDIGRAYDALYGSGGTGAGDSGVRGGGGQGFGNLSNTGSGAGGFFPQGQGGYLAQLLQRMKANQGAFTQATKDNAGAGSLSGGFGGGGRARGGIVNNTPGIVQLLSLLANRNRQF
jgi:hypothetical protein